MFCFLNVEGSSVGIQAPRQGGYEALVVLGGGLGEIGLSRIKKAIEIVGKGLAKCLVLVGSDKEVEFMKEIVERSGVEVEIYFDGNSKNTVDNAYYAKKILKSISAKKIGLVTSAFHMERALAIFKVVLGDDYEITPIPAHDNSDPETLKREELLKLFIPLLNLFEKGDEKGIKRASDLLHELLKSMGL